MKFVKITGAYINPEAVDMIYIDHYSGSSSPATNILLRSGQIIVVQTRIEDVKKAVTEATEQLCPQIDFMAEGVEIITKADKTAQKAQKKGRMEEEK